MTLLREIQQAAVATDVKVPVLLRMCKILAARLGNDDFKAWVEHELSGYPNSRSLPDYRILSVTSRGNFVGATMNLNGVPIPLHHLPKETREALEHASLTEPISSYVDLVENAAAEDPEQQWHSGLVAAFCQKIFVGMTCLGAWKVVPRNALVGVIDAVRNRVLSFALEVQSEAPDAGEAPPNSPPLPQEEVSRVVRVTIYGGVQNLALDSTGFTQQAMTAVNAGDMDSLAKFLTSLGIEGEDMDALREAIEQDGRGKKSEKNFGKRVSEWTGRMVGKAASGVWNVTTTVAADVLTKAISSYYGIGAP